MTDRELLGLAAKAAGIPVEFQDEFGDSGVNGWYPCGRDEGGNVLSWWNPLEDDGDALRLAVRLHLELRFYWDGCNDQYDEVEAYTHGAGGDAREQIGFYDRGGQIDELAATRRAIVRAAASIGKGMP